MRNYLLFLAGSFCMLFLNGNAWADNSSQTNYERNPIQNESFNKQTWEDLQKKVKIHEEIKDYPEKKKLKSNEQKNLNPKYVQIIKWFLFVSLILVLLFLILQTLGINPFKQNKNTNSLAVDVETIAEHLEEADLAPYLMDAIKSGNYKLIIRLYYLQIVQRLNYAGKIKWKCFKTNKSYVYEMYAYPDFQTFKDLTLLYEKCWFGPDAMTRKHFEQICPLFVNYVNSIPVLEK